MKRTRVSLLRLRVRLSETQKPNTHTHKLSHTLSHTLKAISSIVLIERNSCETVKILRQSPPNVVYIRTEVNKLKLFIRVSCLARQPREVCLVWAGRQVPHGLAQDQKRVELLISVLILSVSATATARNSQVLFRLIYNLLITFGRQLSRSTIQLHFYYYYYFIFVYQPRM